jgi:hypothetical protein
MLKIWAIDANSQPVQLGSRYARAHSSRVGETVRRDMGVAPRRGNTMNFSFRHSFALAAVACAGLGMAPAADAKTFKWANSGDVSSMDPYARQETFLLTFNSNIYDPLIRRVLRHPPGREVP